jgi:hypothetical protein
MHKVEVGQRYHPNITSWPEGGEYNYRAGQHELILRFASLKPEEIAARQRCAILCVRHLNKGGQTKAIYRGQGSIDFNAAVRSGLLAGVDPDDESRRAIIHLKSNLAPKGEAIGYTLKPGEGLLWTGYSDLTAEKILGGLRVGEEENAGRREAIDFLRDALAGGEREADEVSRQANHLGITKDRLRRAREALAIKPYKRGFGKSQQWYWALPEASAEMAEDTAEMAKTEEPAISGQTIATKASCSNDLPRDGNGLKSAISVPSQAPSTSPPATETLRRRVSL